MDTLGQYAYMVGESTGVDEFNTHTPPSTAVGTGRARVGWTGSDAQSGRLFSVRTQYSVRTGLYIRKTTL